MENKEWAVLFFVCFVSTFVIGFAYLLGNSDTSAPVESNGFHEVYLPPDAKLHGEGPAIVIKNDGTVPLIVVSGCDLPAPTSRNGTILFPICLTVVED